MYFLCVAIIHKNTFLIAKPNLVNDDFVDIDII